MRLLHWIVPAAEPICPGRMSCRPPRMERMGAQFYLFEILRVYIEQ